MDEYAEEKRTEQKLIVRSGISEAETTKTALDVLYWKYSDTKHRAACLRQQSFLFKYRTRSLNVEQLNDAILAYVYFSTGPLEVIQFGELIVFP